MNIQMKHDELMQVVEDTLKDCGAVSMVPSISIYHLNCLTDGDELLRSFQFKYLEQLNEYRALRGDDTVGENQLQVERFILKALKLELQQTAIDVNKIMAAIKVKDKGAK